MRTSSGFRSIGGTKGRKEPATPASTSSRGTETLSFRPRALPAQTTATRTSSPRASSMRPFCQAVVSAALRARPEVLGEAVFLHALVRGLLRDGRVGHGRVGLDVV